MNTPVKTSPLLAAAPSLRAARSPSASPSPACALASARKVPPWRDVLDCKEVDAFLAVNGDGTVTLFCGKVDLGQGLRIAIPQIAAEELGIGIDKIKYVEGDTALTPNQGRTSGSNGIQRGGVQIRQAAATARKALVELAAQRLNAKADDLESAGGVVRPKSGGAGIVLRRPDRRQPVRSQARSQGAAQGSRELHDRRQAAAAARCPGKMHRHASLHARFRSAEYAARARDPAAGDRRHARVGRRGLDQGSRRRESRAHQGPARGRRRR